MGRTSFSATDLGEVRTVVDYIQRCFELRAGDQQGKFIYRGQPRGTDPLRPTIGRAWQYGTQSKLFTVADEVRLLHRFRRRVYPLLGKLSPLEALFVARHHGLPTRLLDWTANALYALYFASSSLMEEDAAVLAVRQHDDLDELALDPFDLAMLETEEALLRPHASRRRPRARPSPDQVKILFPIFNSTRIVAQDGIFTLHANPQKSLQEYAEVPFPVGEMDVRALYCLRMRAECKPAILRELNGLGITHRTVFPDLDGIVRSLWETEVLATWRQPGNRSTSRAPRREPA